MRLTAALVADRADIVDGTLNVHGGFGQHQRSGLRTNAVVLCGLEVAVSTPIICPDGQYGGPRANRRPAPPRLRRKHPSLAPHLLGSGNTETGVMS